MQFMDLIFSNQKQMKLPHLQAYALQLDLDTSEFDNCLGDPDVAQIVQDDLFEAKKIGLRGTPTVFINGAKLEGLHEYANLKQLIESIINE